LRTCTGEGPPSTDAAEEAAVSAALHRSFHAMDSEILARARAEAGRDGSTGLVLLRLGARPPGRLVERQTGDGESVAGRLRRSAGTPLAPLAFVSQLGAAVTDSRRDRQADRPMAQ
jgi:hypothetical protein